jgi:hypothetical protein
MKPHREIGAPGYFLKPESVGRQHEGFAVQQGSVMTALGVSSGYYL